MFIDEFCLTTLTWHHSMIWKYDKKTLEPLPLDLPPGTREHVLIPSDEVIFHTNDYPCQLWLKNKQQPLKKKGNGQPIHCCNWIIETIGWLTLIPEQIAEQAQKNEDDRLKSTETCKISTLERTMMHCGIWSNFKTKPKLQLIYLNTHTLVKSASGSLIAHLPKKVLHLMHLMLTTWMSILVAPLQSSCIPPGLLKLWKFNQWQEQ